MTTVNTVELKSQASRLLDKVAGHEVVLITRRGHPCAALIPVTRDTMIDLLWEYSPEVQRRLRLAMKELRAGKAQSLRAFATRHGLV
jgi:prevent-host-death family protein